MDFILSGAFMMLIGGLWFGWAYPATEINLNVDLVMFLNKSTFILSSWNLGVIVGAVLGTFAVYQIDMLKIIVNFECHSINYFNCKSSIFLNVFSFLIQC